MKILAIDSTSISASAAVVSIDTLFGEYTINHPKTHSQKLMPLIENLLRELEIPVGELDAIAVANGPGSFTGIRIGLSTAKGLALPFDIPIIQVSSLLGLAFNHYGYGGLICPVMDARRDEVYTAVYRFGKGTVETIFPEMAVHPLQIAEKLAEYSNENVMFVGDGVGPYKGLFEEILGDRCDFSGGNSVMQRASSVGYAALMLDLPQRSSFDIEANYMRASQAEEARDLKKKVGDL